MTHHSDPADHWLLRYILLPIVGIWLLSIFTVSNFALSPGRTLTQYVHRIWQLPQGLPDATITSIAQSSDGYLWLGTETGLIRFDGVRFLRIGDNGQSPLNRAWIRNIVETDQHDLWVGTSDAGLVRLENGTLAASVPFPESAHAPIQCLIKEHGDDFWACTSNGLLQFSGGKLVTLGTAQGLPSSNVRAACKDSSGTLWAGGDGNHLSAWNGSSFVNHPLALLPAYADVRALLCSTSGAIWIGTTNGLIRWSSGQERLFTLDDGLADNWVYSLFEGHDGTLWIGTKNGFSRFRDNTFATYRTEDGLSQSTVYSIFEGREGDLWVGTKHGLNQFLDGRTIPYTVSEGLPTNNVGPVIQDQRGIIWIGTIGAGLCRFEEGRFWVVNKKNGLAGDNVYALAAEPDGTLWVGTNGGLNLLRDGRIERTYTQADGLPANRVQFLSHDRTGALWIGTAEGVAFLQNQRITRPSESAADPRPPLLGGGEDSDGRFLEATETGLKVYGDHEFHDVAGPESNLREVDAFFVDRDGLLWMGTLGAGLRMLKGGKVTTFLMRDGLFDNEIYGIAADSQDRLWFASSKGIFSVSRSDLVRFADGAIPRVVSTPYSPLDGLRTIECKAGVQPSVWKMNDGSLWFATIRGLLVVEPSKLTQATPNPPVVIEDISVNGQTQDAAAIRALAPGRKDLEIHYTALSFFFPAAVRFRYMLDGYDKTWTNAATRRVAYYTNLPPGTFHFRVAACDVNGVCGNPASITFAVASHYYQRPWLIAISAALLGMATWLVWQQRVRSLRQHFEIVLGERSRIARELHDTLIQGFSGITMGMQAIATGLRESDARHRLDELIHDSAHCLTQARQSIAGLRGEPGSHDELPAAIAKAARETAKNKGVELKLNLDPGPNKLPAEVNYNILRIAQEAISNSLQHSEGTLVEVDLKSAGSTIRLTVQDDGKGFRHPGELAPHGHYGLTGMKERASEIGAEFQLRTGPGLGTRIDVVWHSEGQHT